MLKFMVLGASLDLLLLDEKKPHSFTNTYCSNQPNSLKTLLFVDFSQQQWRSMAGNDTQLLRNKTSFDNF
jgi:hypothetical protein